MHRKANIFLSWCHQDRVPKDRLMADLQPALALFRDLDIRWWEDSHLSCGEEFAARILDRVDEADFGLLLLSPRYFVRPFIRTHELPRFAGAHADRGSLPVALTPLPIGEEYDLGGVERQMVFTLDGRAFAQMRGPGRQIFANRLAESIRRRILGEDRYR